MEPMFPRSWAKVNCQVYNMAATTGRKGTHMVQNMCVIVTATTREEN